MGELRRERIIQIIPAQSGWIATYAEGEREFVRVVACWALVEITADPPQDVATEVRGLGAVDGFINDLEGSQKTDLEFIGYRWEGSN